MTAVHPRRLVVVGASLAGLRACESARHAGFDGEIVLVGAEEHLPYDRPPLSKDFLEADALPEVTYHSAAHFADLDVDLRLGTPATGLDPVARVVAVDDDEVPYDALVIATGSRARTLSGTEGLSDRVRELRTIDDARAVRAALVGGARVVVVGAGFIGSEVASSARARGLQVTMLEAADAPLARAVGPAMGAAVSAMHGRNGTDLRCGVGVRAIEETADAVRVVGTDGWSYDADLVVVGVGAEPATGWLEGSGLKLDDGVVCDATLSARYPGVYAAGDVARWFNRDFAVEMRLENWTGAAEQGAVAARNAVAGAVQDYRTVPYFWSDWYGIRIQLVGVPTADEVEVVAGDPEGSRFVALYRTGARLTGALCVGFPAHTMKYRRLIGAAASWQEGLAFAASRVESRAR